MSLKQPMPNFQLIYRAIATTNNLKKKQYVGSTGNTYKKHIETTNLHKI